MNDASDKALGQTRTRTRWLTEGSAPMSGSPAQLDGFIRSENARWGGVLRDAAVKLD